MFLEHLKAPRGLNHGRTSRGAYERALVQDDPPFVNDIEAARCVLLAPHRILLKEFTSLRKKPEDRGGLIPVWGYPWVQPENTTTQTQAEDLFWRWISLKNFTVQELKDSGKIRDLRIEFSHLIPSGNSTPLWRDLDSSLSPALKTSAGTVPSIQGPYTVRRLRSRGLLTPRLLLIPDFNSLRAVNPESVFLLPRVL
ncbi:ATP-binding cassette (ABC) Superfamily [Phytophthora palmivora]|uniref:ATP-binding cassette (ABC) Superfamily n=1 Tax=Phytophthora palmivora TaxID=4796 RepID=A0A2P4YAM7_9STRA|nr:ATP-binding cassette (ABC) Superfamily [Phytophthora palmivora]